jgi:hypothetical protein
VCQHKGAENDGSHHDGRVRQLQRTDLNHRCGELCSADTAAANGVTVWTRARLRGLGLVWRTTGALLTRVSGETGMDFTFMALLSAGELHSGCEARLTRTWSRVLLRPARLLVAREAGE